MRWPERVCRVRDQKPIRPSALGLFASLHLDSRKKGGRNSHDGQTRFSLTNKTNQLVSVKSRDDLPNNRPVAQGWKAQGFEGPRSHPVRIEKKRVDSYQPSCKVVTRPGDLAFILFAGL
jgi:hypothetical protein